MSKVLNEAEREIGLLCHRNAKHPERCEEFLNRYERKVRDKILDSKKQIIKEATEELRWN